MCHILGIEPQFKNIIKNGPFIPMTAGQRNPEGQWTGDERKDANLDQRLKSLIMFVLPDDQMNSIINCLIAKSTWDDLYCIMIGSSLIEKKVESLKNDVKALPAYPLHANVAFVSENTSSTNDVSTAYGVSNPSGHNSQYEQTSSYSLLANQSSCPQLDHEDLEQLDEFD
ncbi:hypothetical protein Tco_0337577 [Tanacetum coccineum]